MKKFVLAGNPNSGKTTLFNTLTGSTAHVGNWPGVTVDKKEGFYKKEKELISIMDLPGIYSLSPYTPEEVIARNYILNENVELLKKILSQYHHLLYQPIDANGLSLLHYAVQKGKKRIVDELSSMMFENNGTNVKDNVSNSIHIYVT